MSKALSMESATARLVLHLLKALSQIRLSSYLQLNEQTCNHTGNQKKDHTVFIEVVNKPIIYKIFNNFTNNRKKTKRAVLFSP